MNLQKARLAKLKLIQEISDIVGVGIGRDCITVYLPLEYEGFKLEVKQIGPVVALDEPIGPCNFDEAWVGRCKNPKPCDKHKDKKCSWCKKQAATHNCPATIGSFVCGYDLCGNCTHTH